MTRPVLPTRPTVLVTGASAGIGRALAVQLAPAAGRLVLLARRRDALDRLALELRARHAGLVVHIATCDLSDRAAVDGLIGRLGVDLPTIDLLVANAGIGHEGLFETADPAAVSRVVEVNVLATTLLLRAVVPGMVERGCGAVLVIGSGAGLTLMPRQATYTATKHYIHALTQSLRAELTGTGVTVTEVCPGPVATEFDEVAGISPATSGPGRTLRMSAQSCAAAALAGLRGGVAVVYPGTVYRALMTMQAVVPLAVHRLTVARAARAERRAHAGGPHVEPYRGPARPSTTTRAGRDERQP